MDDAGAGAVEKLNLQPRTASFSIDYSRAFRDQAWIAILLAAHMDHRHCFVGARLSGREGPTSGDGNLGGVDVPVARPIYRPDVDACFEQRVTEEADVCGRVAVECGSRVALVREADSNAPSVAAVTAPAIDRRRSRLINAVSLAGVARCDPDRRRDGLRLDVQVHVAAAATTTLAESLDVQRRSATRPVRRTAQ